MIEHRSSLASTQQRSSGTGFDLAGRSFDMSYEFQIEERSPQPTLTVRKQISRAEMTALFDSAFSSVIQRLGELGEEPTGPPFAYYHNLDMENPDIEAGFPVGGRLESHGDVQSSTLPGGRYCTTMHVGTYDALPEAWAATIAYANEQGYTLDEYAIEFYITNPTEVAPEDNQTQIVLPLK